MKKVYIPTIDELYKLQEVSKNGKHMYQYILTKAIEVLVIEGVLEPEKGMLKIAYEKFEEFPEIAYAICRMYPEEIDKVEAAQYDINLCCRLIESINKIDNRITRLDEIISRFENGILTTKSVINTISKSLVEHLPSYPRYRFEYKPNYLLDEIFSCEIETNNIPDFAISNFMIIDPIYITKLSDYHLSKIDKKIETDRAMYKFSSKYGIAETVGSEYYQTNIISNPDEQVKKLIRCLEHHKRNYR